MSRQLFVVTAAVIFCATALLQADDSTSEDVTSQVKAMIKNNSVAIAANNDNFDDPAEGATKKLRVKYTIGSSPGIRTAEENQTLTITADAGKKLEIQSATYGDLPDQPDITAAGDVGPAAGNVDVTKKLTDSVKNDRLTITANNKSLGADPAVGADKRLMIHYTVAGVSHKADVQEGKHLEIPTKADGAGPLVIIQALWGVERTQALPSNGPQ